MENIESWKSFYYIFQFNVQNIKVIFKSVAVIYLSEI